MAKSITLFLTFLLTVSSYSQNHTLIQNVNPRAQELTHLLNKTRDSLILKSNHFPIYRVDIYNKDSYSKLYDINYKKYVKIPLNDLSIGRFNVEVWIKGKIIVMSIINDKLYKKRAESNFISLNNHQQNNSIKNKEQLAFFTDKNTKNEGSKYFVSKKSIKYLDSLKKLKALNIEKLKNRRKEANTFKSNNSLNEDNKANTSEKSPHEQSGKTPELYWIVKHINSGYASSTISRFGDIEDVKTMIVQQKIDLKSKAGKYNTLTVWEIYDTLDFIYYKRQNPNYNNAKEAESFNVIPYYTSKDNNN